MAQTAYAKSVKSSLVSHISYDSATKAMEVTFKTGPRYRFEDVPADLYDEFCACESFGRFFNTRVKGNYKHSRLDTKKS